MPSFRARVLDALNIQKKTVKLQVNERYPKIYNEGSGDALALDGEAANVMVNYAISKELIGPETLHDVTDSNDAAYNYPKTGVIGPNVGSGQQQFQTLDVLGFVVGDPPSDGGSGAVIGGQSAGSGIEYKNTFPVCTARDLDSSADRKGYTGFWHLNGIYDNQMHALRDIRKSAIQPLEQDTQFPEVASSAADGHDDVVEHSHKDWPDNILEQFQLLNDDKWADSLYYHQMRISLLINGITIPSSTEKASNHRGLVRLLVLRPKLPSCKVRFTGDSDAPVVNMAYPPHFDTDLFYSGKKTLAGRLDKDILRNDATGSLPRYTHISPTFGLQKRANVAPEVDVFPESIHYGHPKPDEGDWHDLNSYDIISAPINRDAYHVIEDKTFTLDTRHHGAAAQRLENIVIPFNKKIRFPGRLPDSDHSVHKLTVDTNNEPLNLRSRPIVMLLSMDQKISCQVTGYTAITEC